MRRRAGYVVVGVTALAVPLGLADMAAATTGQGDRATVAARPLQARLVSGKLPDGSGFTLPDVPAPPYPIPAAPTGIGGGVPAATVESTPRYVPQTSCDPSEKPGITAFKRLVLAQYSAGSDWGSARECALDGTSEHLDGRAWDWHVDVGNAAAFNAASNVLQWLTTNNGYEARRLGIMYIGYNYRIWGSYSSQSGWRVLSNSNHHTDHVHFSFTWNGAMKSTSFWTGAVSAEDYGPCPIYKGQPAPLRTGRNDSPCAAPPDLPANLKGAKLLWRGSTGARVTEVQNILRVRPANGTFGPTTQKAVLKYQRKKGLPLTAAVDAQTYYSLGLGKGKHIASTSKSLKRLAMGSKGKAVRQLQKALGMHPTGVFGKQTRKAVIRWQKSHGMKPTGVASRRLQMRLGL